MTYPAGNVQRGPDLGPDHTYGLSFLLPLPLPHPALTGNLGEGCPPHPLSTPQYNHINYPSKYCKRYHSPMTTSSSTTIERSLGNVFGLFAPLDQQDIPDNFMAHDWERGDRVSFSSAN